MSRSDEYGRYAAECMRVAQQIQNPGDRAAMLAMAQKWQELAEKAKAEEGPHP